MRNHGTIPHHSPSSWVACALVDGDGEDFEDDLDDAITHVTVAKAYWDARTKMAPWKTSMMWR